MFTLICDFFLPGDIFTVSQENNSETLTHIDL